MTVDPAVLAALRAAVEADPANGAVRLHLAHLLVEAGEPGEALAQVGVVLGSRPDDVDALTVAATAAEQLGDPRAVGYRRLLDALSGPPTVAGPTAAPDAGGGVAGGAVVGSGEVEVPDSPEELLASWADTAAPEEPEVGRLGRPRLGLADVGGLDDVKARLHRSFLDPLRNPELRARFGASMRGGLLLWGPPGCGKTYLARAVAGELGASFYEVGLADVLDVWIGASEKNLRSVFEVARRNAPCVLFFDELDALGIKRTQLRGGGSAMRGVVNQLLVELDGVGTDNDGVFVLGATNHPWDIDSALLRPGRFDRKLLVLPPDQRAREAILATHLAGRPVGRVDLGAVAGKTDGLSGADLGLVCAQATEAALGDSLATGTVRSIEQADLLAAVREVRPSIGPWLETARNYAMFNNGSGEFDDLLGYLGRRRR